MERVDNLHILLLSRSQPNITLATFCGKGMAFCVDAAEMRFTQSETEGYLAMRGLRLTKRAVDSIQKTSDGWISAIYLLGEGIRLGGDARRLSIDNLFSENLIRPLPEIDRDLLFRLSVLPAFTLDLACDALGSARIKDVIESLLRENAFITRDIDGVCRFHPLFLEYLKSHCPNDGVQKNVCRRAGIWAVNHAGNPWLFPVTLFEMAQCIPEFLAIMNRPDARRLNYYDLDAICRAVVKLPAEKCLEYPLSYMQIIFYMMLSGENQPMRFAGELMELITERIEDVDEAYRNMVLGELIIIKRVTSFESFTVGDDPIIAAAKLLAGKPSLVLRPEDPFTFGLPMQLHAEFMEAGTLDAVVERCQHNAYELVTDGFGRGSEKLTRAEAALLRCQMNDAKRFSLQAIQDASEKKQYFIIAGAYFVMMRRALFLGDADDATGQLSAMRSLIAGAICDIKEQYVAVAMLRQVLTLAECFYNTTLRNIDDIPKGFLDGTHHSAMVGGLGVTQMYMARAMYQTGDITSAERICDSLDRLPSVCQCARLYRFIISALCKERFYGAGSGLTMLKLALSEAQKDAIVLPFAENPDIAPLIERINHKTGASDSFLNDVVRQCNLYLINAPKKPVEAISLSEREREAISLIAIGKTRAEVAKAMNVQENTVKTQLSSAYRKLGAKGKIEAIRIARIKGLL